MVDPTLCLISNSAPFYLSCPFAHLFKYMLWVLAIIDISCSHPQLCFACSLDSWEFRGAVTPTQREGWSWRRKGMKHQIAAEDTGRQTFWGKALIITDEVASDCHICQALLVRHLKLWINDGPNQGSTRHHPWKQLVLLFGTALCDEIDEKYSRQNNTEPVPTNLSSSYAQFSWLGLGLKSNEAFLQSILLIWNTYSNDHTLCQFWKFPIVSTPSNRFRRALGECNGIEQVDWFYRVWSLEKVAREQRKLIYERQA